MIRRISSGILILIGWTISLFAADLQQLLADYRTSPNDWRLCYQIGLEYVGTQQLDDALTFFTKAAVINPQFLPAQKNRSTVLWFLGKKEESEREFRKIVATVPADQTANFYLGMASHDRKQYAAARSHFTRAGDLASRNPEALPAVVESFLKSNDLSILPRAIETLRSSKPLALEQIIRTAELLMASHRAPDAVSLLADLVPGDPTITSLLARAYEMAGQNEQAYASYVRAIDLAPTDENYLALSLFAAAHQNSELALGFIRKGLATSPDSPRLLLNGGILLALNGSRAGAEDSFRRAAAAKPEWAEPFLCLGILKLEDGAFDEAARQFRLATQRDSKDFRGSYLLAVALSRTGSDADAQVIDALNTAISLAGNDARPHILLGQTYLRMGKLDLARKSLELGMRLDSKNSSAVYQLGLLYRKLGNPALATKYMNQFRALKEHEGTQQSELVQILKVRPN